MQKTLSVLLVLFLCFSIVPCAQSINETLPVFEKIEYTDTDSVMNAPLSTFYYPYDSRSRAVSLIGDDSVFLTGCDSFYVKGGKHSYSSYSWNPYKENNVFMIPAPLFASAFDLSLSLSGNTYTLENINITPGNVDFNFCGTNYVFSSAPAVKDNVLYLPLIDIAEKICGLYTYDDGRMIIVSRDEITLSNSTAHNVTSDPIDTVYRFLAFERPSGNDVYSEIDTSKRPKILTTSEKLAKTKALLAEGSDGIVNYWYTSLISVADSTLEAEFPKYQVVSGSLTTCARNVLENIENLSAAYLLTGDVKYAKRCHDEMKNALSWQEWNAGETEKKGKMVFSGHYLGLSELTRAMATGFDSIYHYLTEEERAYIIEGTIEKSLSYSLKCYKITTYDYYGGSEWRYSKGNWGAVCSSAIISACISFAGEENQWIQENAPYLLGEAMHSLEYPLMLYYPDGAWYEGLSYWNYASDYLFSAGIAPVKNATGKTYSLLNAEGVSDALTSVMYLQTPDVGTYNYADASCSYLAPEVGFLICDLLSDENLARNWMNFVKTSNFHGSKMSIMKYNPMNSEGGKSLPLDRYFKSADVGVMKESWQKKAAFVGIKAGLNNSNHSHLDLGSFIYENNGIRWAQELGADDYHASGGYWGTAGYQLYVKRPEGQNCVVINPRADIENEMYGGQSTDGYATLTDYQSGDKGAYMVLDLSDAYKYDTSRYIRGFYLGDDRNTLTIKDEFTLLQNNSDIYWFMHTKADISVSADGKSATLTTGEQTLNVTAVTNGAVSDFHFEEREIKPFDTSPVREDQLLGEFSKSEFKKLTLVAKGSGDVEIAVKLADENYQGAELDKISQWTIPDGIRNNMASFVSVYENSVISEKDTITFTSMRSFDKATLHADGKEIAGIYNGCEGVHSFTPYENAFRNIDKCTLSLKIDSAPPCDETNVTISEVTSRNYLFDKVDFEKSKLSDSIETIKNDYSITIHAAEDVNGSLTEINGSKSYTFTSDNSKNSYIQKSVKASGQAYELSFDVTTSSFGSVVTIEPKTTSNTANDRSYYFNGMNKTLAVITSGFRLGESDEYVVPGKTYRFTLHVDLNNKRYILYVEDKKVGSKKIISNGSVNSCDDETPFDLSYFRLNFRNNKFPAVASCTFDNISLNTLNYSPDVPEISGVSYKRENSVSNALLNVIPKNADSIFLELDTAISSETLTDYVSVYCNGELLNDYSAQLQKDEKTISVSNLKGLTANGDLKIVLSGNIKPKNSTHSFMRDFEVNLYVSDENLLYVKTTPYEDDMFSGKNICIKNASATSSEKLFFSLVQFDKSKITNIKTLHLTAEALSDKTYNLKLPKSDNLRFFMWKGFSPVK